jgi:hypothetical protein
VDEEQAAGGRSKAPKSSVQQVKWSWQACAQAYLPFRGCILLLFPKEFSEIEAQLPLTCFGLPFTL